MKKFITHLYESREYDVLKQFVMDNVGSHTIAANFNQFESEYPLRSSVQVYRGLNFTTPQEYLNFRRATKSGSITISSISSWSKSYDVAVDFAKHKKTYGMDYSVMLAYSKQNATAERIMGFIGVVLRITATPGNAIDLAEGGVGSESEVIMRPGTYRIEEVIVEKKYQQLLKSMDTVSTLTQWMNSGGTVTDEIKWLLKNRAQDIDQTIISQLKSGADKQIAGSVNIIVNLRKHNNYFKQLTMYPDPNEIDLYVSYSSTFQDALAYLGIEHQFNNRSLSKQIAAKIEKSIKPLIRPDRAITARDSLRALKFFGIHASDIPSLRSWAASSYVRYNQTISDAVKNGKDLSRVVDELRSDLESFMQIAGL